MYFVPASRNTLQKEKLRRKILFSRSKGSQFKQGFMALCYLRPVKIIEPKTEQELKMYYDLRYEILRKPWKQTYASTFDEWEKNSVHGLMLNDRGEAIAAGRLQINSDEEGQVRSMAVKEGEQNKGLGTK